MKPRPENVLGIHHLFIGSGPLRTFYSTQNNCEACHRLQTGDGKARRSVPANGSRSVFSRSVLVYRRPVKARIMTIKRIKPRPPLGQYPQPELYGQAGSAPTKSRITMINRMVPICLSFPALCSSMRRILDALRPHGRKDDPAALTRLRLLLFRRAPRIRPVLLRAPLDRHTPE